MQDGRIAGLYYDENIAEYTAKKYNLDKNHRISFGSFYVVKVIHNPDNETYISKEKEFIKFLKAKHDQKLDEIKAAQDRNKALEEELKTLDIILKKY